MRTGWMGACATLALLAGCQDRNPGDNDAQANVADARPIDNLALPPENIAQAAEEAEDAENVPEELGSATSAAPGTIPAAFQGRWAVDRARCGDGQQLALTVMPKLLRFYESEAKVKQVEAAGPRAITVTSSFSGEGQSWEDSQRLSLSSDGRTLTIAARNTATRRVKCS